QQKLNVKQTPVRIVGADVEGVFSLAIVGKKPDAVAAGPSSNSGDRPPATHPKPSSTDTRPTATDAKPPVADSQPTAPDAKPPVVADKDVTVEPVGPLNGHTEGVVCVAFSPDGKSALSGGKDWMVRLWDLAKQMPFGQPVEMPQQP